MTAFEDIIPLDTERLMNDLYAMQASFKMLLDQLARQPPVAWDRSLLNSLLTVHALMECRQPSLRRH